MLTKVLIFGAVALLTRSPLAAALVTLAVWLVVDWNGLRLMPRLGRRLYALRQAGELRRTLFHNPHDRRARIALADIYNRLNRSAAAVEAVRPAVEADPSDVEALFQLGLACLRQGDRERGELFLDEIEERHPDFRQGEIRFEEGRARLRAGDATAALASLQDYLGNHAGSVRGLVLLAAAKSELGDDAGSRQAKAQAWQEFTELPRFARRDARPWAWRANPTRPFAYLGVAAAAAGFLWLVPRLL
jgi:tetratricopeptide (TPR) repeat protein